jgi:hypothetical protein
MKNKRSLVAAAWAKTVRRHKERLANWHASGIPEGYTVEDFEKELARARIALDDAYGLRSGRKTDMTRSERQDRWEQLNKDMQALRLELDQLEYDTGLDYLAQELQQFDPLTPEEFSKDYWEDLNKRLEFFRHEGLVVGFQWEHVRNEIRDRGHEAVEQRRLEREAQQYMHLRW